MDKVRDTDFPTICLNFPTSLLKHILLFKMKGAVSHVSVQTLIMNDTLSDNIIDVPFFTRLTTRVRSHYHNT